MHACLLASPSGLLGPYYLAAEASGHTPGQKETQSLGQEVKSKLEAAGRGGCCDMTQGQKPDVAKLGLSLQLGWP